MKNRRATNAEILGHYHRGRDRRVSYRHFVQEIADNRTEHGVAQRQRTSARIHDVDGVPHVRKGGVLEALTATHFTLESGTEFLTDLRLDNKYLPGLVEKVS